MIRTFLLTCLLTSSLLPGTTLTAASSRVEHAEDVVVKAIKMWLKLYRQGKLDFVDTGALVRGVPRNKKDFVSIQLGILKEIELNPEARPGAKVLTHHRELVELCNRAANLGTAESVDALLEVARVACEGKRVAEDRVPAMVGAIGDQALSTVRGDIARDQMVAAASSKSPALRAAALKALGWGKREKDRPLFVAGLVDKDLDVRRAAAIGLGRAQLKTAIEPLADFVQREKNELALGEALDALVNTIDALGDQAKQHDRELRRAATSAIRLLGQHSWQVDQAAIQLMKRIRTADAVPALIDLLQRWIDAPEGSKLGKLSGRVREDAYDLLTSLSGANFPKARPDQWKEWWERVHDEFKVAEQETAEAAGAHKTTTSFFGIPVRGSHVLFVCDFSGSMEWPSDETGEGGQRLSKMQVAARELVGAVNSMSADSYFNLAYFSTAAKAWKPKLLPATAANKKKFDKFINSERADGGTNLWGGLKIGFDMKGSKTEGSVSKYDSYVDEIFVLSDGEPSLGEIIVPEQILAAVREANRSRRIRINTIFIEGPEDEERSRQLRGGRAGPHSMKAPELMQKLAAENGGVYLRPGEARTNK